MKQQVVAYQKYLRHTPQKMRLVADLVRNMGLDEALVQLKFSPKRAAKPLRKVLTQAKANASHINLNPKTLTIKSLLVDEGATFKRWQPVSRGRAHPILKRTCHVKVVVEGEISASTHQSKSTLNKPTSKSTKTTKNQPSIKGK